VLVALLVLFLAELFVIVQVAHLVGVLNTVVLLVVVSVVGVALMRRAGLGVWRRARARVEAGEVPGRELIDGVLVLTGAALLAVPGFITDVLGLLLFLPPVRALVRTVALRRLRQRASITVVQARTRAGPTVVDARARPAPRAELPPDSASSEAAKPPDSP
jgi:UPF0716 protein FxsA